MSKFAQAWLYAPAMTSNAPGKYHVIILYHDSFGGKRNASLDFVEIENSAGVSSMMMQGVHKIPFVVQERPGYIEIKKLSMRNYLYKCVIDNALVPEAHGRYRSSETPPFTAAITSTVFTSGDDDASSVAWYGIEVLLRKDERQAVVMRRFSEFVELEKTIQEIFRGRDELPTLPKKVSKALVDHSNTAFLEERKQKLTAFLDAILCDPTLSQLPALASFLGFPSSGNVRELSFVFTAPSIDSIVSYTPAAGYVNGLSVSAVVHVINEPELCPLLEVGDAVVKVGGCSVAGWSFPDVITRIKRARRPLIIHFWQILPEPRLSIRDRDSAADRASLSRLSGALPISPPVSNSVPAAPSAPPPPLAGPPPMGPSSPPPPLSAPPLQDAPGVVDDADTSQSGGYYSVPFSQPPLPAQPPLPVAPAAACGDDPDLIADTPAFIPPRVPIRGMGRRASAPSYEPPPIPVLFAASLAPTLEEDEDDNDEKVIESTIETDDLYDLPLHAPPPPAVFLPTGPAPAFDDEDT